ncbi:MAG: glycosyltransferase family 9 protein [Endomicrobia bacterium]|jgi:heptosyltransferase-2|nr:glycosyltransferase family 9 protein [Endomicrobiia bacterium]
MKKQSDDKHFLILARSHIGDFIWTTSAVAIIKKRNPASKITIIAPKSLSDFINNNPIFDNHLYYNSSLLGSYKKLVRYFYKVFFILKTSFYFLFKKADFCFLFSPEPFLTKAALFFNVKKFIFPKYECCGCNNRSIESIILNKYINKRRLIEIDTPQDADNIHCSEIYQTLVRSFFNITDIGLPVITPSSMTDKINSLIETSKSKKIALCFQGAKGSNFILPPRHSESIIAQISKTLPAAFFIVGGKEQTEYGDNLISKLLMKDKDIEIKNLSGKTSLLELKSLLGSMDLLISVDTGIAHIAATQRINSITIFGKVSPNYAMPMSPNNVSIYSKTECSPCLYGRVFEGKDCAYKEPFCLQSVSISNIVNASIKLLK